MVVASMAHQLALEKMVHRARVRVHPIFTRFVLIQAPTQLLNEQMAPKLATCDESKFKGLYIRVNLHPPSTFMLLN